MKTGILLLFTLAVYYMVPETESYFDPRTNIWEKVNKFEGEPQLYFPAGIAIVQPKKENTGPTRVLFSAKILVDAWVSYVNATGKGRMAEPNFFDGIEIPDVDIPEVITLLNNINNISKKKNLKVDIINYFERSSIRIVNFVYKLFLAGTKKALLTQEVSDHLRGIKNINEYNEKDRDYKKWSEVVEKTQWIETVNKMNENITHATYRYIIARTLSVFKVVTREPALEYNKLSMEKYAGLLCTFMTSQPKKHYADATPTGGMGFLIDNWDGDIDFKSNYFLSKKYINETQKPDTVFEKICGDFEFTPIRIKFLTKISEYMRRYAIGQQTFFTEDPEQNELIRAVDTLKSEIERDPATYLDTKLANYNPEKWNEIVALFHYFLRDFKSPYTIIPPLLYAVLEDEKYKTIDAVQENIEEILMKLNDDEILPPDNREVLMQVFNLLRESLDFSHKTGKELTDTTESYIKSLECSAYKRLKKIQPKQILVYLLKNWYRPYRNNVIEIEDNKFVLVDRRVGDHPYDDRRKRPRLSTSFY